MRTIIGAAADGDPSSRGAEATDVQRARAFMPEPKNMCRRVSRSAARGGEAPVSFGAELPIGIYGVLHGEESRRFQLIFDAEGRELRDVVGAELTGGAIAEGVPSRVLTAGMPEVVCLVPPIVAPLAVDRHARCLVGRGGFDEGLIARGHEP